MSNFKRILSLALTMLMVLGCFAAVASVSAFEDVTEYEKEIDTVVDAPLSISGPNLKPYLILGMIGLGAASTAVTVKIDERLRRKKNEV